jgi:hypothetical protein
LTGSPSTSLTSYRDPLRIGRQIRQEQLGLDQSRLRFPAIGIKKRLPALVCNEKRELLS